MDQDALEFGRLELVVPALPRDREVVAGAERGEARGETGRNDIRRYTHQAAGAGFFAQTWDMHDSATEHVVLLEVRPDDAPAALVFTTVGCLAQIGMNEAGVAVGINRVLVEAPLAGAHNYLVLDADGVGFNVEAMATHRAVSRLADRPLVHTNHAIAPEAQAREATRAADLVANSQERLRVAERLLDRPEVRLDDLFALTAEPDAICRRSEPPHHLETSGAAICRPRTRELWAVWGRPGEGVWERFVVG